MDDKIKQLDQWFQFAETIGQSRLYNFLMAASILFLACAALMASEAPYTHYLATALTILGMFISAMWSVLGTRQAKFHEKIDSELRNALQKLDERHQFAIYHIQQMKDAWKDQPKDMKLNRFERSLSNRRFLFFVPISFGVAFFIACILAVCHITKH